MDTITAPAVVQLGSQVVIGTCDIAGAGARALLALQAPASSNLVRTVHTLQWGGAEKCRAVYKRPSTASTGSADSDAPLLLVNYGRLAHAPLVSLLVVNTPAASGQDPALAHALLQYIQSHAAASATPKPVLLACALRMAGADSKGAFPYVLALNAAEPPQALGGLQPLPGSTRVLDGLLAALIHCIHATGQPAVCLVVPGYKPSRANVEIDPLLPVTSRLGQHVAAALGLVYDEAIAGQLMPSYVWQADLRDHSGGDIMYL
ncbi:hypothetical protein WJX72_003809 [[Myrmecia] bisecta]|uniref:Proteasome assembly chaperone 2 n=1 Tax=[Myrmecia] bisecta TaxID=41462 RepID=A0AAW1QEX2_9CHLO